jgi:DNA-binding GntR family transcriptional regulator
MRRQAIVTTLLEDVFRGRFRAGQHLVTEGLAKRFGVSHTPIREALIALAGIGILDLLPNRGAVVRRVTARDVREIMHVRWALECAAVRSACGRVDLKELDNLAEALRRQTRTPTSNGAKFIGEARAIDSRLHDLIAHSCGNAFLANELSRLKLLFRAFRDVSYVQYEARNDFRRLAEEAHEHLAIVEALRASDRREASRAMTRHLKSGLKYWCRALPAPAEQSAGNGQGRHRASGNGQGRRRASPGRPVQTPADRLARKTTRTGQ